MKTVKIKKGNESECLGHLTLRADEDFAEIDSLIADICKNIKEKGDAALEDYLIRFDRFTPGRTKQGLLDMKVSAAEFDEALGQVDPEVFKALSEAADSIREYHEHQYQESWFYQKDGGILLGQKITPIENIGLYVPGGKAAYPSAVLFNAIPAKVAGCKRIAIATPPGPDGKLNPVILAAAKIVGVDEIYKVGGAQAIAALAYGTETVPKVDKIAGPGNVFATRAKRMVYGSVGIDMIAGPSEVCVIADSSADPVWTAADVLSQSEHDEMSCSIFITDDEDFAKVVNEEVERQLKTLDREPISRAAIENNGLIFIAEDMDSCFEISNLICPEHLELLIPDSFSYLDKIRNAGAVFFGEYTPQPLGDYVAGPNHTLPTSGTSKYASPLGVYDFMKRTSLIKYNKTALEEAADRLIKITDTEGLTAHGKCVKVRLEK